MRVRSFFSRLHRPLSNKILPFRHSIASFSNSILDYDQIPEVTQEEADTFEMSDFQGALLTTQQKHGDIVLMHDSMTLGFGKLQVYHPDLIKKVYDNEGSTPEALGAGNPLMQKWAKDTGRKDKNLFLSSGKKWRKMRTVFQRNMTSPQAAVSYYPVIVDIINEAVKYIPENPDIKTFLKHVSTDTFQTLALGRSLGLVSGKARKEDSDWLKSITDDLMEIVMELTQKPEEVEALLTDGTPSEDFTKMSDLLNKAVDHSLTHLNEALERLEAGDEKTCQSYIAHRVASMKDDGLDFETLAENVMFFLLAAIDTTSSVMNCVLYNLANNPEIQETLRQEIISTLGYDKPLTEEHVKNIPYWRCVLKETYRLTPTVNISSRTLDDDIELGGYNVPKNTPILVTSIPYLWSPEVFDDPMKFDPTRWDRSKRVKEDLASHPYLIMPASKGKRMCVAIRTAEVEMSAFFCRLLQTYRITLDPDSEKLPENRTMMGEAPNAKFVFEPLQK